MLAPGRTSMLLRRWVGEWRSSWGLVLIAGTRYAGLDKVTDTGLKAFGAALGSSTTITTVDFRGGCFGCFHVKALVVVESVIVVESM